MEQITNHIDYEAHSKLQSDVEQWVANGGQIKQMSKSVHAETNHGLFDKPKSELAKLAKRERRSSFLYVCPIHAVTSHKTSDMTCRLCSNKKIKNIKELTNKYCGAST